MDLYEKVASELDPAQKQAGWGAAIGAGAKALGSGALNFGKGMFFAGATRNAGLGGKAMNMAGKATAIGGPIASSMGTGQRSAPSASVGGMEVSASLDDRLYALVRSKRAFEFNDPVQLAEAASYAAFIGAKLAPKDSPWHTGLDVAGLAGLSGATAADMYRNPEERKPGVKDLIGLALMSSALHDRMSAHGDAVKAAGWFSREPEQAPAPASDPLGPIHMVRDDHPIFRDLKKHTHGALGVTVVQGKGNVQVVFPKSLYSSISRQDRQQVAEDAVRETPAAQWDHAMPYLLHP